MDAIDFIQLGIKLLVRGSEAEIRTAVSRLYYGAFHIASGILRDKCGIELPQDQAHAKIPQLFCQADDPRLEEIGRQLNSLRKTRRIADYELKYLEASQLSWGQEQLLLTQEIVQGLDNCSSEREFQTSVDNIRSYARNVLKLKVREI